MRSFFSLLQRHYVTTHLQASFWKAMNCDASGHDYYSFQNNAQS